MITMADYLGPYASHPDATSEIRGTAARMLDKVNRLHTLAEADGVQLRTNPKTGSRVSGSGNGGFRPQDCPVGSASSPHKIGRGVDTYDPDRSFAAWCLAHIEVLAAEGLFMEDPRWTPTWTHLDDRGPKSGRRVFIPSNDPPLCAALPGQVIA